MELKCIICYKKAETMAYGNTYCLKHYKESPYYMELQAKKRLEDEKEKREN